MEKQIIENLKWFHFSQNNSGGYFNINTNEAPDVFIQAKNADEANAKSGELFDFNFCSCCGERWSSVCDSDGTENPEQDGKPYKPARSFNTEARLHYFDGRIETIKGE